MLNPIEEKKFQELKDKCRELRVPPPPDIMIGLKVHDKNGILVFDDVQRGHSWTRWFWNSAAYWMLGWNDSSGTPAAGQLTLKETGGVTLSSSGAAMPYAVGGLGNAYGLVVGTGDTAFTVEQYALAALIAHGTGSGQFSYTAQTATTASYTGGTKTWASVLTRIFNNNSGGSITVKETGLYSNTGGWNVMLERSVLDPTVTVATGGQLTVTYDISMDFSAID